MILKITPDMFSKYSCLLLLLCCGTVSRAAAGDTTRLQPVLVTEPVQYDTDDPAIWINNADPGKSLVIGTDKDSNGALYAFDLQGKITGKVSGLQRPNNVDIAYGLTLGGQPTDIAILTERITGKLRIYRLPDLAPLDNGGIPVFAGEKEHAPMGIALYTRPTDHQLFAIVGRKTGPSDNYLWQYQLNDNGHGMVRATLVRKFGKYSGKKEIESIAVDNEPGYIYYSDEQYGIHKYAADPDAGNTELALFGQGDFREDLEGISIYKHSDGTGYILVSDQQANTFNVYPREGTAGKAHEHRRITAIPVATIESDGSDVCSVPAGSRFPQGLFVAMSNGRVFQFYDWRQLQERIDQALQ
jgi:3-phytase